MWDEFVTLPELGKFLGLKSGRARELAADAVFVRAERGRYDLIESVRGYCAMLREQAAGRSGQGLSEQRARLANEQANAVALKNAIARGDYAPISEMKRAQEARNLAIVADILALPGRIHVALPHLSRGDIAAIDRVMRDRLTKIGTDGPDGDLHGTGRSRPEADPAAAVEAVLMD